MSFRIPTPVTPLEPYFEREGVNPRIRRSLCLMLFSNICGTMCGVICGGSTASMIGLANLLGADDFSFGLLNGIPQAATVLQLFFAALVNRTHKRKKYIGTFGLISRAMWMLFGLIPLIMPMASRQLQLWSLIFLLGISSCMSACITPCWYPWFSDICPNGIRTRWLAIRDMVDSAASVIFGLLVAWLLEALPESSRYVIIFALGGAIGMVDMLLYLGCEETYRTPPVRTSVLRSLKEVVKNRSFMSLTIMWTLWNFTGYLASSYHGRYCINEMGFSFMQCMIFITMAQMAGTMVGAPVWGRIIQRIGTRNSIMISCLSSNAVMLFYLLCTPGNIWPPLLANFLGAVMWSGASVAVNTLQLTSSPEEDKPTYIAFFACVTGLAGIALGTVCGGSLLQWWADAGMFTGSFDRYKVLTLICVVSRMIAVAISGPKLDNQPDGKIRDLFGKK